MLVCHSQGPDRIPSEIQKRGRLHYDFSKYTTVEPNISNNANYVDSIEKIAERIYELHEAFSQYEALHDCENFSLPSEADAIKWLDRIGRSAGVARAHLLFPGRQEGQ